MNKNNPVGVQPFRTQPIPRNLEPCTQFRLGNCRYGGNCKFGHNVEQRLDFYEPKRAGVVEMGQFLEGKRVVRQCKWSLEMCPYGKKCVFVHKVELGSKRMLERSVDGIVLGGQAKRGCRISGQEIDQMNDFKVREGLRKTKMCHKWENFGSCPYGGACHYAHGREELKNIGPVSNPGLAPDAFAVNLLTTHPMNCKSGRKGSGSSVQKKQGKERVFKWNDIEKISRIYADWVDLAPVY